MADAPPIAECRPHRYVSAKNVSGYSGVRKSKSGGMGLRRVPASFTFWCLPHSRGGSRCVARHQTLTGKPPLPYQRELDPEKEVASWSHETGTRTRCPRVCHAEASFFTSRRRLALATAESHGWNASVRHPGHQSACSSRPSTLRPYGFGFIGNCNGGRRSRRHLPRGRLVVPVEAHPLASASIPGAVTWSCAIRPWDTTYCERVFLCALHCSFR